MIQLIITPLFFFSLTQGILQDKINRCRWIKTALYKQVAVFNKLTDEDKQRLHVFSMRGIVLRVSARHYLHQPAERAAQEPASRRIQARPSLLRLEGP